MRYLFGIVAALGAGTAFNLGILIQKSAVDRLPKERPLLRSLVKSPIWLLGFVFQFVFGTPLYILSIGLIGPAVVPGLMAIGLVALTVGAVRVRKERLRRREIVGIGFVILAVASFGLSRLSIDVLAFSMTNLALLRRSITFAGLVIVAALACAEIARRITGGHKIRHRFEPAAVLHAVRAGLWYNVSNLSLGFITAGLALFGRGIFDTNDLIVFAVALVTAIGSNFFGVAGTQNALARGRAAVTIPLQEGVAQLLPVGIFFFVYRPYVPTASSFVFLGIAASLLVTGVILLTNRLSTTVESGAPQSV